MKNENPYIVYTDDKTYSDFDQKLDEIIERLGDITKRLDDIEANGWVTTQRIANDSVTGAKIAPFKDW